MSSGWSLKVSLSKQSSEWNGLARQSKLPFIGGRVTIGRLIITSGVILEGIRDSIVGGWGSDEGSDGFTRVDILDFFLGGRLADFLGWEELAPGVVGGLLASYRLRGGLGGAPSTEGERAGGCEGSVMDSCMVRLSVLWCDLMEMGSWLLLFWPWLMWRNMRKGGQRCAGGFASDGGPLESPWRWCCGLAQFHTWGGFSQSKWLVRMKY